MREILRNIRVDDRKFHPRMVNFLISNAKNKFLDTSQAKSYFVNQDTKNTPTDYGVVAANAYEHYQEKIKAYDSMDFDDLLLNTVYLLENNHEICRKISFQFKYILVDEFQDTNPTQFRLLKNLTKCHQNLCVVGDDDQSIYAWRGAEPSLILNFNKLFPSAKVITLDQNYRSTPSILQGAHRVIQKNKSRHPKTLWSDRIDGEPIREVIVEDDIHEAEWVAGEIFKKDPSSRWSDYAILFRANAQSRLFEEQLRLYGIPYRLVGSLSYLDRKEIKDILSYWKIILNPKDDTALRRILNRPARGIGAKTVSNLNQIAAEKGIPLLKALEIEKDSFKKAKAGIESLLILIGELNNDLEKAQSTSESVSQWAKISLQKINYQSVLMSDYPDDAKKIQARKENIEELANGIGLLSERQIKTEINDINARSILSFYLSRLQLNEEEKQDQEKDSLDTEDRVSLMTFHAAKGLEFDQVFMIGCEDGIIPHKKVMESLSDLDEERRLFYVGMTRAKNHLTLTRCKQRVRFGKAVPRTPSRFLLDLTSDDKVTEDLSITPDPDSKESWDRHESRVKGFLDQIRNQLSEK